MTIATLTLAERILAGDLPKADYPLYSDDDWRNEAQYALDAGDDSELRKMVARENGFQSFRDWQGRGRNHKDAERREFTDFEDVEDRFVTPRVVAGMGVSQ